MADILFGRNKVQRTALRMRKGNAQAAGELYEMLVKQTFGFIFSRIKNREKAEDLTQDIFMKLIRSIERYDESKGEFVVWYWRMVRNSVIDYYRVDKSGLTADIEVVAERGALAVEGDMLMAIDMKSNMGILQKALRELSSEEQELFEYRYIAEMSYKEIGEITGKSEGALRVQANRIKKKLNHIAHVV